MSFIDAKREVFSAMSLTCLNVSSSSSFPDLINSPISFIFATSELAVFSMIFFVSSLNSRLIPFSFKPWMRLIMAVWFSSCVFCPSSRWPSFFISSSTALVVVSLIALVSSLIPSRVIPKVFNKLFKSSKFIFSPSCSMATLIPWRSKKVLFSRFFPPVDDLCSARKTSLPIPCSVCATLMPFVARALSSSIR